MNKLNNKCFIDIIKSKNHKTQKHKKDVTIYNILLTILYIIIFYYIFVNNFLKNYLDKESFFDFINFTLGTILLGVE